MPIIKKQFNLHPEAVRIWGCLWPTFGTSSESGAFCQLVFSIDEWLRQELDEHAISLYEAGRLTRGEKIKACSRARKAGNGEKQAPALVS